MHSQQDIQQMDVATAQRNLLAAQETIQGLQDQLAQNQAINSMYGVYKNKTLAAPIYLDSGGPAGQNKLVLLDASSGVAPTVSVGHTNLCNSVQYIVSTYGTVSPQFVSSAGNQGQKNLMSIIGAALGIFPIAMGCSKSHASPTSS
jgi:hypothetical protein